MLLTTAIAKEFKLLARDLHGVAVLFILPVAFMLIMSAALSKADAPPKPQALALIGEYGDYPARLHHAGIAVRSYPAAQLPEQQAALQRGDLDILLVNPNPPDSALDQEAPLELWVKPDADPAWLAAVQGQLQRYYSETRLTRHLATQNIVLPHPAMTVQANAQLAAISAAVQQHLQTPLWDVRYLSRQGETVARPDSVQHSVPAWLIFGMFFITIPLSNVMSLERTSNTLTRLRMAQAPAYGLLGAKLLPYFAINQLQFFGMIALGYAVLPRLGLPAFQLNGAFFPYWLIACATGLAALGYALLVSVHAKSSEHAVVLGGGGIILMAALGGIMVPVHIMPAFMQQLAQLSPMHWALTAFQNRLLNHAELGHILPQLMLLTAFAAAAISVAAWRYRRQLLTQGHF